MRCLTALPLWVAIVVNGGAVAQERAAMIKYVNEHAWSTSSTTDLTAPGRKTVTLLVCPPGVKGEEPEFWIYSSATDTPEAVKVTGGSCNGDGKSGTLQFMTSGPHRAGYQLSSASDGLQEALIAGRFTPTNPAGNSQSGKIVVAPGEYRLRARVSV